MVKATAKEIQEPVEKGIYKAKIVSEEVEERVIDSSGNKAQYINFQWEIIEGPNAERTIEESVPLNFSKKSDLGKLWNDLKGETMEGGQDYDTANLHGIEAQLTVVKRTIEPKSPDKTAFDINKVEAHLVLDGKTEGETVKPEETSDLSEAEQEHLEEAKADQKKLGE